MALTLTDEIIRNRVNLQHDNLEDVKALSLPGTYHEKVVSLGSSLRKFSRLKSLDLSRNAVSSLQGLDNLKMLEKLNLYYNCIEDFNELKRLQANVNLKELDLRLNPITRTEPDYRLYMIHMLPNLQKLDDRGVRDRERHAALTHFSTSQATEMTDHDRVEEEQQRVPNPRAEFVKDMGKGVSTLDDDDVAVLDLIARTGGDLGKARQITGSSARQPTAEDYSLEVLKSMSSLPEDDRPLDLEGNFDRQPVEEEDSVRATFKKKYPNIPSVKVTSCHDDIQRPKDSNLMYEDEADAYNKYKSHGYFTKNPGAEAEQFLSHVPTERDAHPSMPDQDAYPTKQRAPPQMFQKSTDSQSDSHRRTHSVPVQRLNGSMEELGIQQNGHHMEGQRSLNDDGTGDNTQVPVVENQKSRDFLFKMLDVVDRYWNGSKSLHKNVKFKVIAYGLIDALTKKCEEDQQFEKEYIQGHLSKIKEENKRLKQREEDARKTVADHSVNESHLKASLHEAYKEVEKLKEEIHKYATENREIQKKLQGFQDSNYHHSIGAASVNSTVHQSQLDDLQKQNDSLKNEILLLQARLKQFGQLQDLASMLQESHKSLVKTNDHLLKDMNDLKRRHHHEVEQLNWSYDQLKKTMNYLPSTSRDNMSASAVLYDSNT